MNIFTGCFSNKNSINQKTPQPFKEESAEIRQAKGEIEHVCTLLKNGNDIEAIELCKTIHETALSKAFRKSDAKIIDDKLFEVGLEVALAGNHELARQILDIAEDLGPQILDSCGMNFYSKGLVCFIALDPNLSSEKLRANALLMKQLLKEAIQKNVHLQFTPYFLGKAFEGGLYGLKKSNSAAEQYLKIAEERGYKPRRLTSIKNKGEPQIELDAQQQSGAVFCDASQQLANSNARMRAEQI